MGDIIMANVTIGPEFFKKELNEYADWVWAFIREACQNSIDARGCDHIRWDIRLGTNGDTVVVWENNGAVMDEDVILNKLFSLGTSGKNFEGSVGGFGKAKVLLYFAQDSYVIQSGDLQVSGVGGTYDLQRVNSYQPGTCSVVVIGGDHVEKLSNAVKKFAAYCQWRGSISLRVGDADPSIYHCNLRKGSPRRDLSFGKVYTNKSFKNRLIVRMGGMPMFSQYVDYEGTVLIELTGSSAECLTANRDGLNYKFGSELRSFVADLSNNRQKALNSGGSYVIYEGDLLGNTEKNVPVSCSSEDALLGLFGDQSAQAAKGSFEAPECDGRQESGIRAVVKELVEVAISTRFVLLNRTDLKIPSCYIPQKDFSDYSSKLLKAWGKLLVELYKMEKIDGSFSVGFVFSEPDDCGRDTEASYEGSKDGHVYFISPAQLVKQSSGSSRSFKKRFLLTERDRLLSIAVHEFVHGAYGLHQHNETYAAVLTEIFAKVMKNRKRFNKCFI
jgi:hypothetical protein